MKPPVDAMLWLLRVVTLAVYLVRVVDSVCVQLDARTYAQRFQVIQEVRPCTRGAGKVNEGCEMVAHCCPGYYFYDQALQQGLHLVCKGGRWSERRTQQTKTNCVPGCHALRPNIITELGNATIVTFTQPNNPWVNGYKAQAVSIREIYWARGTVVVTRCKPGYSFEDAHHRQKGTDSFTCMGGSTYWQDNVTKKTAVSRPGLCKPNCDAITVLPSGVELVTQPGSADVIRDASTIRVLHNSIYRFRCKNGAKAADGRTEQMLICQGGPAGYYDTKTAKSRASVFSCARDSCKALRPLNAVVANRDCRPDTNGGMTEGCKITVKCKEDYYLADRRYANGQDLECHNAQWVDSQTKQVTQPAACLPGCRVLREGDPQEMGNATFVGAGKPSATYRNGEHEYWAAGVVVETKCKEYYAFDEQDNRNRGQDKFKCIGGNEFWRDEYKGKYTGGRPGLCPPLCNAISERDLPTGVRITLDPAKTGNTITAAGKVYTYSGSIYKFQCLDGYSYADGKSSQTLICRGGEMKYYDAERGIFQAPVRECLAEGCTLIQASNIDVNASIAFTSSKCTSCGGCQRYGGMISPEGCEVNIRCREQTHYFESRDYMEGQRLMCRKGQWVDQLNRVVRISEGIFSAKCRWGCPALTDLDMINATYVQGPPRGENQVFKNGDKEIWAHHTVVITKCKKGFARPDKDDRNNEPNKYICEGGYAGWVNTRSNDDNQHPGRCDPMCQKPQVSQGTSYVAEPNPYNVALVDGVPFVYWGTIVQFHCDKGYELPPGAPDYPNGQQMLICRGGDLGFYDTKSGRNNAAPITCTKSGAQGCTVIKQETYSPGGNLTFSDQCQVRDGVTTHGCRATLVCNQGYYPDTRKPLRDGRQQLECKPDSPGWQDPDTGDKNQTFVICLPGCEKLPISDRATLVPGSPRPEDEVQVGGKWYYKRGTIVKVKCKSEYVPRTPTEREHPEVEYECRGGSYYPEWINKDTGEPAQRPGETCSLVCDAIKDLPSGVTAVKSPGYFEHQGKSVVEEGRDYLFKCIEGYKYPANSPPAKNGQQHLICAGGPDGYRDDSTNHTRATVLPCERGTPAGCTPPLDVNCPPPNTNVTYHSGCPVTNDRTAPNCKATLECLRNFYPKDKRYAPTGEQRLKCVDDGRNSQWRGDDNEAITEFLECLPGCELVDPLLNAEYVEKPVPTERAGSRALFKKGTIIIVKCKPGRVLDEGDPEDAEKPIKYECRGGPLGWHNLGTDGNEDVPGDRCLAVCPVPKPLPEGVRVIAQPAEFFYRGQMSVKQSGKYSFKCVEGYFYPKDTPYNGPNRQDLECDGPTGQYRDLTNAGKFTKLPTACQREKGQGCKFLTQDKGVVESEKCPPGVPSLGDGCKLTVRCKDGYYPANPIYHKKGRQELVCRDGKDWIDQAGKVVNDGIQCLPGCPYSEDEKKVIHVSSDSGKSVNIDNFIFYMPGAVVRVTCFGDGVVWRSDVTLTKSPHDYVCRGGNGNWERREDNKTEITLGEGCVRTCPVPKWELPDSVREVQTPIIFDYGGEKLAVHDTSYILKCKPKHVYNKKSPHREPGKQTLICNGEKRRFEDEQNPSNGGAVPEMCERPEGANECKEIAQDPETTIEDVKGCIKDGHYYPTGCQIEVSCKPGYYPKDKTYLHRPGSQVLSCQSGGRGWADQYYRTITTRFECVKGCIPPPTSRDTNTNTQTITNNFFIDGVRVKCTTIETEKDSTTKPVTSDHDFYCALNNTDGSTKNVIDKSCENACRTLAPPLPEGVRMFRVPIKQILQVGGNEYVAHKGEYVLECKKGYQYKPGTVHFKNRNQVLRCNGATYQYDDPDAGVTNAKPVPCEEVKGCEEIKQDLQKTDVKVLECLKSGNILAAGCALEVRCLKGFYPKKQVYLSSGYQQVRCSPDGSGWKDQFGETVNSGLECLPGCINPTHSLWDTYHSSNVTEKREYVFITDFEGHTLAECLTVEIIKHEVERRRLLAEKDHKFYCHLDEKILNDTVDLHYDDFCKDACAELMQPLPANVQITKVPKVFTHAGRKYVGDTDGYTLQCADGFTFPPDGQAGHNGYQKLICNGGSHRYDDPDSGIKSAPILPCTPVQGCKPLPQASAGTSVIENGCAPKGGVIPFGCQITSYCLEGYYPADKNLLFTGGQNLRCLQGTGERFTDEQGTAVTRFMECVKGCIPRDRAFRDIATNLKRQYTTVLDCDGKVVSKCATIECMRREIETRTKVGSKFLCPDAGNQTGSSDSYYDDFCDNACKVLQEPLPYGIKIRRKPPIFPHGGSQYTINGGVYDLVCEEGFAYPTSSMHAKLGMQKLRCNGVKHAYEDAITGQLNPPIGQCVRPLGCRELSPPGHGVHHDGDKCQRQAGDTVAKGCKVTVTCEKGYYPADEKYLVPGQQVLTCAQDGSGWQDQTGGAADQVLVDDIMRCRRGCVVRHKAPSTTGVDAKSVDKTYNLPDGLRVHCRYHNVTRTSTIKWLGPEHRFYCKIDADADDETDSHSSVSPCSNACKALKVEEPVRSAGPPPRPLMEFDGVYYVRDGYQYTLEINGDKFVFPSHPPKKIRNLVCDGSTGTYRDPDSGECSITVVEIKPCD